MQNVVDVVHQVKLELSATLGLWNVQVRASYHRHF